MNQAAKIELENVLKTVDDDVDAEEIMQYVAHIVCHAIHIEYVHVLHVLHGCLRVASTEIVSIDIHAASF